MNKFNTLKFLRDHKVLNSADEAPTHHHCSEGHVQVHCPFCMDSNWKLGLRLDTGSGNCWACGKHDLGKVIKTLLRCDWNKVREIKDQYSGGGGTVARARRKRSEAESLELPAGTGEMDHRHKDYLRGRNFNPRKLEELWSLKGTGPLGKYAHRIIIPIMHEGRLASYQGRDVTGLSDLRYKACEVKDEVVHHKHLLYGQDQHHLSPGDSGKVVVVEGVTDAWRLGPGAVCTFGTGWTQEQLNILKGFKGGVWIWYDESVMAQSRALRLANELALFTKVQLISEVKPSIGDPAELDQDEADEIMKRLMGGGDV